MKMACALALAELARLPVPDEVTKAFPGRDFTLGVDYVIPTPFDPRLITVLPLAVAKAAMETGVAKTPIDDLDAYAVELKARMAK